ncbi:MAG: hypothetical protein HUJ29_05185 [Gammaproteobacteria bacterium]|nr:hypothetical protein [Gammaproteobacteria bacterium]
MRLIFVFLLLFITACTTTTTPTVEPENQNYRLRGLDTPDGVGLASQDFYSVYYIYTSVIRALELDAVLSRNETETVIRRVIDTLKQGNAIQLIVPHFKGGFDLRVTLRTDFQISKDTNANLLIVSNYDPRLNRTVTGDNQKDAYATYFLMAADKLIKHQYVDRQMSPTELNALSLNALADYYLFDADPANDQLGRVMLVKAIPRVADDAEKFLMYLTLSHYELLAANPDEARVQLAHAEAIINAQRDARLRQKMSQLYSYAGDILYYYNQYHH